MKSKVFKLFSYAFEFLFGYINHLELEKNLWCSLKLEFFFKIFAGQKRSPTIHYEV